MCARAKANPATLPDREEERSQTFRGRYQFINPHPTYQSRATACARAPIVNPPPLASPKPQIDPPYPEPRIDSCHPSPRRNHARRRRRRRPGPCSSLRPAKHRRLPRSALLKRD